MVSQKGFTIKNNGNDVDVTTILYRNGEELDSAGTAVVKTYTGKAITVAKADVTGKGVLM